MTGMFWLQKLILQGAITCFIVQESAFEKGGGGETRKKEGGGHLIRPVS